MVFFSHKTMTGAGDDTRIVFGFVNHKVHSPFLKLFLLFYFGVEGTRGEGLNASVATSPLQV